MSTFKSYSEKSKARRALVQVYGILKEVTDQFLTEVDGKHGFYLVGEMPVTPQGTLAQPQEERKVESTPSEADVQALGNAMTDETKVDEEDSSDDTQANNAFGAFAAAQLGAAAEASAAAAQPSATVQRVAGLKIEKDRAQANGVKERSKGGLCRAVWDALNSMMTHDEATGLANVPTVADIKKLAEEKGWNVNNASIEYYQWRKFHGISGRGKKQI